MVRIAHLSDLHFGRDRPELLTPLVEAVNNLRPDLIAVSGDLTQRARPEQFAEALAALSLFEGPRLVVPGNHDVPLWNLPFRLLRPFKRYRRHFGDIKEPTKLLGDVLVLGVNSVDPWRHQRGRMDARRITRTVTRLRRAGPSMLKVVVMHHPFVHPPGSDKAPMPGARDAARAFSDAGADIVLSGHLHSWNAEPFRMPGGRALLFVQAGTGLSNRTRGEPNDFNLIDCAPGRADVTRYCAGEGHAFLPDPTERFEDGEDGWCRTGETPAGTAEAGLDAAQ